MVMNFSVDNAIEYPRYKLKTFDTLKAVSATFLLVSSLSVNESYYQTKNYFTSKALPVIKKIKF